MDIQTTIELISSNKDNKEKDYWISAWRINKAIKKMNEIASLFATGKVYQDESVAGVIHGIAWRKQ